MHFNAATVRSTYSRASFGSVAPGASRGVIPRIKAASLTKKSTSASLHLPASCARRVRSLANASSKSKNSRAGGGGSRNAGGKIAGVSGGNGASKCGGMSVSGLCSTPHSLKASTASGTREVSREKRAVFNSLEKSRGSGSGSWRHGRSLSATASTSGTEYLCF